MDFPGAMPLRAGMDDDRRDLIVSLCTQVVTCSPDCYQSEVESGSFMMVD